VLGAPDVATDRSSRFAAAAAAAILVSVVAEQEEVLNVCLTAVPRSGEQSASFRISARLIERVECLGTYDVAAGLLLESETKQRHTFRRCTGGSAPLSLNDELIR
jgi:hypothetical protein